MEKMGAVEFDFVRSTKPELAVLTPQPDVCLAVTPGSLCNMSPYC